MNLQRQTMENNILTTAIGFLVVLFIPFYLITGSNLEKLEMLYDNKINVKRMLSVNPDTLHTKVFLNGEEMVLEPILELNKTNLVRPLSLAVENYRILNTNGNQLGEGFVNGEGKLVLNGEPKEVQYAINNQKFYVKNGRIESELAEGVGVKFGRDGTLLVEEDRVLASKYEKFERQFVRFYINSVILKKNQLFLNKFIRDKDVYRNIMEYKFSFNGSEIIEMKKIKEEADKKSSLYYLIISPMGGKKDNLEFYIRVEKDDKYAQYNSFSTLVTEIKILEINKDKTEEYKNNILEIVKSLFGTKDLFSIELLMSEKGIKPKDRNKVIKQILNTEDVEVGNITKQYDYVRNREVYKVDTKNLTTYNILRVVFVVNVGHEEKGKKKVTTRTIENMYIEGE